MYPCGQECGDLAQAVKTISPINWRIKRHGYLARFGMAPIRNAVLLTAPIRYLPRFATSQRRNIAFFEKNLTLQALVFA